MDATNPESILVIMNGISAGLGDRDTINDFHSARCQYIANATGIVVVGAEQPFTASTASFSRANRNHIKSDYINVYLNAAGQLHNWLREETDMTEVNLAGNSGGGTASIIYAQTNVLPVSTLSLADPYSMQHRLPLTGAINYGFYQIFYENNRISGIPKTDMADNYPLDEVPRLFDRFKRSLQEIYVHSASEPHAPAYEGLVDIAVNQPDITVRVDFTEYSPNGGGPFMLNVATGLNEIRNDPETFRARFLYGKLHSYFDSHKIHAQTIAEHMGVNIEDV